MKKQKKQNLLTVIIIILVIALVMMIGSIVYEEKMNMSKQPTQDTSLPVQDETNDKKDEEKNPAEVEDDKKDDTPTEDKEYVGEEENNAKDESTTQSKDEKAIDLVKKEWGNDDSVTFSIEQKKGTKYYVAVKSENEPTVWYEVDTENWKVSEY